MKTLGGAATLGVIASLAVLFWLPPLSKPSVALVVVVCVGLCALSASLIQWAIKPKDPK